MSDNENAIEIPVNILKNVNYVFQYAGSSDDYLKVRSEIISRCSPWDRNEFHRRHYSTKKIILNDLDYAIIEYWEELTGRKVFIDEERLHPKDWQWRPHGWKFNEINKQRKAEKRARERQKAKDKSRNSKARKRRSKPSSE